MKPTAFSQSNRTLQPPKGMSLEECGVLEVYTDGERCISRWRMTWRERWAALLSGHVWLWVWFGETQPPVALTTDDPFRAP